MPAETLQSDLEDRMWLRFSGFAQIRRRPLDPGYTPSRRPVLTPRTQSSRIQTNPNRNRMRNQPTSGMTSNRETVAKLTCCLGPGMALQSDSELTVPKIVRGVWMGQANSRCKRTEIVRWELPPTCVRTRSGSQFRCLPKRPVRA